MNQPYLILAPDYTEKSAGISVLHKLGHLLNRHGQEAYMISWKTNSGWDISCLRPAEALELLRAGAIAVYPEIIHGNPFNARTVVRYILNNPGLLGGNKEYPESEVLFAYLNTLLLPGMGEDRILNITSVDTGIFYNHDGADRDIEGLLYLGKYAGPSGDHPRGGLKGEFYDKYPLITRTYPDRKTLGDCLRRCKTLYTYDNFTMLTFEAVLCGCMVVIIPDGIRKREDVENGEYGMNGIAWGLEDGEIERARATLPKAPEVLKRIEEKSEAQLDNFIGITQARAAQNEGGLSSSGRFASVAGIYLYFGVCFNLKHFLKHLIKSLIKHVRLKSDRCLK